MSAGTSSSSGTEDSNVNSTGQKQGTSTQNVNSNTTFDTNQTSQTKVPAWARQGAQGLFNERAGSEHEAVDFLTGLLSNPLDNSQPKNRYASALDNLFETNLTRARSGDAQSVGVGKQGQREAAALTDAQTAAIGTGASAANSLLTNANPFAALDFTRLISPTSSQTSGTSNTQGVTQTNTDETSKGTQQSNTTQSGSNGGFGITICCFIFLEAYHGNMPWFVRRCRDEFCSNGRVEGYNRMARTVVPLMRKSQLVRSLVWLLMIKPLTAFGGWIYGEKGYEMQWWTFPFTAFWFSFWNLYGRKK